MAATRAVTLIKNSSASSDGNAVTWVGGRCALILIASSFPTTCKLQLLGQDAATWIDINATTYSANQVTAYDLPAGQYRMHMTGGTTTNLYADLVSVPYI